MDVRGAEARAAACFNTEEYTGGLRHGRYHGFGCVTFANGNEYRGAFVDGRMHGLGTMAWEDGLRYVGEWRANVATGVGCLSWPNGAEFLGEVSRGRRHGAGVQVQGHVRYAGEWVEGRRHGFGTLQSQASEYVGEWCEGRRHGWGRVRFRDGNTYEGMWREDRMCGFGTMTWVTAARGSAASASTEQHPSHNAEDPTVLSNDGAHGGELAAGPPRAGETSGSGSGTVRDTIARLRTQLANVGTVSPGPLGPFTPAVMASSDVSEHYAGEWKDNRPHGRGKYEIRFFGAASSRDIVLSTINRYCGDFSAGKRHGRGTQYYADGTIYEGGWHLNMKHGRGSIIHPDGTRDEVEMENDAPKAHRLRRPLTAKAAHEALQIEDIMHPTDSLKDVMEVIAQHRNTLKHLYAAYCVLDHPLDFTAAARQVRSAAAPNGAAVAPPNGAAPAPEFASREEIAPVAVPAGFTPTQRNAHLLDALAASVGEKVSRIATTALERITQTVDEYRAGTGQEGSELSVVEGRIPDASEIADELAGANADASGELLESGRMHNAGVSSEAARSMLCTPMSNSRGRRAATPLEGLAHHSLADSPAELLPPPPMRREARAQLSMHQLFCLLEDALVTDVHCQAAAVAAALEPMVHRLNAIRQAPDESPVPIMDTTVQHPHFLEALVRIADYKFGSTLPFFACNTIHRLTIAQRFRYLVENFIAPVSTALREVDSCPLLRELGVSAYIPDTTPDTTLDDLRRQAVRALRDSTRQQNSRVTGSGGAGAGDSVSVSAIAELPSATPQFLGGGAVAGGDVGAAAAPVAMPDARPLSAGADGLDLVSVPFVAPPEVVTTDVVGRRSIAAHAAGRGGEWQLEFVVVLVRISPGHIRKKHIVVVNRHSNGTAAFGGIIVEFQLNRVQHLFCTAPAWFVQRGLPALRPRHLLHFVPCAEALEGSLSQLVELFEKCGGALVGGAFETPARLHLVFEALAGAGLLLTPPPHGTQQQQQQAQAAAPSRRGAAADIVMSVPSALPQDSQASLPTSSGSHPSTSGAIGNGAAASATTTMTRLTSADPSPSNPTSPTGRDAARLSSARRKSRGGGSAGSRSDAQRRPTPRRGSNAADSRPESSTTRVRPPSSPGSAQLGAGGDDLFDRVSAASTTSIAPSQYGQLLGLLTPRLPESIRTRRSDAVARNVLFACMMYLVDEDAPRPCTSLLPLSMQQPIELPRDTAATSASPQLRQLYRACPELLEAVMLRASQEEDRNHVKRAFAAARQSLTMQHWELLLRDVHVTFDQFLQVFLHCALLLAPSAPTTEAARETGLAALKDATGVDEEPSDVMQAVAQVPAIVSQALAALHQRVSAGAPTTTEAPTTAAEAEDALPLRLPPCWPVKKKPPPKEDPKGRKKGNAAGARR